MACLGPERVQNTAQSGAKVRGPFGPVGTPCGQPWLSTAAHITVRHKGNRVGTRKSAPPWRCAAPRVLSATDAAEPEGCGRLDRPDRGRGPSSPSS